MPHEALTGAVAAIVAYVVLLLAAFVVVYVLLHRLTREERRPKAHDR